MLQVIVVIGFFLPQTEQIFEQKFDELLNSAIVNYRVDPDLQNIVDYVQINLECCGAGPAGPNAWDQNLYFNCTNKVFVNSIPYVPAESCGVPFSCCSGANQGNKQCGYGARLPGRRNTNNTYNSESCSNKLKQFFDFDIESLT